MVESNTNRTPAGSPARFIALRNLVTYLSLLAGLISVYFAALGHLHLMAAMWAASALADNVDGDFARLVGGSDEDRRFGIELDSFVDCLAFGAFPVVAVFLAERPPSPLWEILFLAGAMAYLVATVTRLGYYDLMALEGGSGFVGLPTTEAALLFSTFLLFPHSPNLIPLVMLVLAVMMVSPVPVPRPRGWWFAPIVLWPVVVLVLHVALHLGP